MRLRKIKLSGFKSFVDPTTLIVPGNLVGIVGPNGCGKSNIIDAVTWVMGESSAKHLRGESLTDVIFNGSSARQPVSQAMVELVFDNTEGKAGGQYASYNEISIKRQINRESISVYYLNGSRCRRKDIHEIFLGTGLGPRGYSIIEQGMISRLIEAKPDELRVFIEEAAGISRYREKRRETENRMVHTRENLDRLNDIREELGKQLNHLQRQAKSAERYQVLKQEERQLRAELMALNYRELKQEIRQRDEKVSQQATRVEERVAHLRSIEADIEKRREELSGANESFNKVQSEYYQVGGDISQLEQKIEYSNEKITSLGNDISKVEEAIRQAEEQHRNDQERLRGMQEKTSTLEPQLQGSRNESNEAYDALNQAEQAMQKWQDEWDAFKEADANFRQQIEVYNARLNHLREGLEDIYYRRRNLTEELELARGEQLDGQLGELDENLERSDVALADAKKELENYQQQVAGNRERCDTLSEKITENRTRQQKIEGTLAGLVSLQKSDAGSEQAGIDDWLAGLGQADARRLYEEINVEPEWAHALETVLGQHLQSVIVNDFKQTLTALESLSSGNINLMSRSGDATDTSQDMNKPRLLDRISATGTSVDSILQKVYLAEDVAAAVAISGELGRSESVITRSGIWIGQDWIRVNQSPEEDSVLLREQRIQSLKAENEQLLSLLAELETQLEQARTDLAQSEQQHRQSLTMRAELHEQFTNMQSKHAEIRGKRESTQKRIEQVDDELESLQEREEAAQKEITSLEATLGRTREDQSTLVSQKEQLTELRNKHQLLLDGARNNWQSTHEQSHEIALQLESLSSQKASLEQAIKRTEIQVNNHRGQVTDLRETLDQVQAPLADLRRSLESRLAARLDVEKKLSQAREQVQTIDIAIRENEQARVGAEQAAEEDRTALEKLKMDAQEVKVRLQTVEEQLQTEEHDPDQILAQIEEGANKVDWQERIVKTEQKIQRLGPINLAAIDEYNQLSERKEYLDRQDKDLNDALLTLENAIKKIDKETRTRFKETFDKLNANLKEMFPVLFGGGHAFLEMTGNDLLDTGVAIMARPPGKKNASIHLLSGGEKAMTAVALVFAIFKLNPAPFCILDEVDAPLDDTNAGRFSDLLGQMSSEVQFLVITHNKITMEIAQQLLGVTMHEPGVSRLVSVDIEEAVQMAASA